MAEKTDAFPIKTKEQWQKNEGLASGFKSGFKEFSHAVAHTVNVFFLLLAYFVGVGLVALFARIARKQFLPLQKKASYWVVRNLGKQPYEEYKRTF